MLQRLQAGTEYRQGRRRYMAMAQAVGRNKSPMR